MALKTYKILYHLRLDKRLKYELDVRGKDTCDAIQKFKDKNKGKYVITSVRLIRR